MINTYFEIFSRALLYVIYSGKREILTNQAYFECP
jgi:hypothetical protein